MIVTCPCGKQEDEYFGLWLLEIINHISSVGYIRSAVQSEESVLPQIHEVLKDVDHLGHLAKDKDFVSIPLLFLQDSIQFLQLG